MATIHPRKNKRGTTYQVLIRANDGHPPIYRNFPTKQEAKDWAKQEEARRRQETYFPEQAKKHTLSELIDLYLEEILPSKPKNAKDTKRHLAWWKDRIGKYALSIISYDLIDKSRKVFANQSKFPYLQINKSQLAEWIDTYIRTRLFGKQIDPLEDENWRVLLLDPIANHINGVWARQLLASDEQSTVAEPELMYRQLSEVPKISMRQTFSIPVNKCIYERLRYPSRNGEFEKQFIETANEDSQVERFCKIDEHKHSFLRLRYINSEGTSSFYHPDFLVKIEDDIFLVETKATGQGRHPEVKTKSRAALAWCERINQLQTQERMNANWSYVLIEQNKFNEWSSRGANLKEILELAKIRDLSCEQLTFA